MKYTLLLILVSFTASAQVGRLYKVWPEKMVPVTAIAKSSWIIDNNPNNDTARYHYPVDTTKKYLATVTFTEISDTVWSFQDFDNTLMTHTNMTTLTNQNKPGISNKSFSYVTNTSQPANSSLTATGSIFEFYGERFSGHGQVDVYIDGVKLATLNQGIAPLSTDLTRGQPSFRKRMPKGSHKIEITSRTGQHMVDFIRIHNYTLK